jgi:hypothetical protein
MEAIEIHDPMHSPAAVHSLVRRSMGFIDRHLGPTPSHGNRRLELSQVVGLLLSAAMQPTVRSLRLIEQHSAGPEAREITRRQIVPRSTLSDALAAFDPEALRPVIEALQARLPLLKRLDPEAHDIARRVIAADGSWFNLAGEVACALEMNRGKGNKARQSRIRLNLQLDVDAFLPVECDLSGKGDGSEAKAFIRRLKSDCIYVVDRNFVHFEFIAAVKAKGSNLVLRLKKDVKFKAIENRPLTPKDDARDVLSDEVGMLPGPTSKSNVGRDSRTGPPPQHTYRRIVARDRKNQTDLILLTDLLDAPAWVIAELYRLRWQIELFLRWLKVFANFDHLISQSPRGMTMQFYVAVLLTLLLHLKTGLPVSKHTLHIVAMSAGGQLDDETLAMLLARRERERTLERLRRQRKRLP